VHHMDLGRLRVQRGWLAAMVAVALVQSPWVTARAGQSARDGSTVPSPGRIVFQHDGKNVSGFVLYLQPETGSPIRIDLGMLKPDAKGLISAALPKLPPGSYRAEVAAYNMSSESPRVAADPPSFVLTWPAAARSEANHATNVPHEPVPAPAPKKTKDKRTEDSGSKKSGVGKRFWKVLVGDDDKP
jgi:hypothetical protein